MDYNQVININTKKIYNTKYSIFTIDYAALLQELSKIQLDLISRKVSILNSNTNQVILKYNGIMNLDKIDVIEKILGDGLYSKGIEVTVFINSYKNIIGIFIDNDIDDSNLEVYIR